jgi:energy-coupling factor transporter transmembrane protein EcfT
VSTRERTEERPRREPEITFLRLVPGDSPLHRLWAGTKVLLATELMITATFAPTWITLGVIAVLVLAALLIGRIPLGAFPRLPAGFYYLILLGLVLSSWSTAEPIVRVGPFPVSVGALEAATRLLLLAIVLMVSAAIVGWTTPLGAIAPALSRLARPFRALRLPVDEWILAIAVALRCLPLLVDEMRTLYAARRLRWRPPDDAPHPTRRALVEMHDIIATAIIVSLRRAHDLADAMHARGGVAVISAKEDARRTWRDAVTLVGVTAISVGLIVVTILV